MAHAICTHNGNVFDRFFYEAWCNRFGYTEYRDQGKVWIDTKVDVPFPDPKWHNIKLKYLAAEHGILHRHAHGALPDAEVMLEILDKYNLNTVLSSASSPTVIVQALVSFADKDKAKDQGYYWRPTERQWVKAIKASKVQDEMATVGFPIKIIQK